jgi:putative ABC transport system permease protein
VGLADAVTFYFGTPTLVLSIADVQRLAFAGQALASAIVTRGVPRAAAPGLRVLTDDQVVHDLERPMKNSDQTLSLVNALLWIVAAGIIGSIVYLSALERGHDFAVLKATGATNRSLLTGLALQAVVLATAAALLAAVLAAFLAPIFPFTVSIPGGAYVSLVAVALAVGLLSSLAGLRRAVRVDPALAFGGA